MSLWLNALGASVRFHDVNGVRTRCLEAGEGQAVLLLHGIGGHVEAFAKNVVPLAQRYRVIAVDMLGHGMTDKPDGDYMPPDYAAHILALMDTLGIARAHIVGESLGSWVAYWMIQAAPSRVLSWTCCVGAGLQVDGFDNLRSPGVAELRKRSSQASAAPTRDSIRARLEWLFHEPGRFVSDELVETRLRFWSNPDMLRIQPMIAGIMDPERGGSSTSPPNGSSASPRRRTSSDRIQSHHALAGGRDGQPACPGIAPGHHAELRTLAAVRGSGRLPPAPARLPGLGRRGRRLHAGFLNERPIMLLQSLGYVGVETTRLDEWRVFGPRIMGLEVADATASSLAFRMDDRKQRILVDQGSADGAVFYGWRSPTATRWNGSPPGWTGPASGWRPCRGRRPTDARWGAACASSIRRATAMKPFAIPRWRIAHSGPAAPCRAFAPVRWAWAMSCSWRNASKTCFLLCRRARIPPERLHAASLQGLFLPHQRAAP